ncbi:MAG: AsmA family protein, partial [Caulobacteraceae bacterium]|nr:AsmA family protein [Caulobacteraceae bacterium]
MGVLIALLAVIILILVLFDWNWLRGPLSRFASARLHRPVAIEGNLKVH